MSLFDGGELSISCDLSKPGHVVQGWTRLLCKDFFANVIGRLGSAQPALRQLPKAYLSDDTAVNNLLGVAC